MPDEIEIRSEPMRDIIGYIPHWIIRSGITVIFTIITVFFIGTIFFKYPDVIKARVTITTISPVAKIIARTNGKIEHLFVRDNEQVKSGEILAIIENPADYNDVLKVKSELLSLKEKARCLCKTNIFLMPKMPTGLRLGEMQSSYAELEKRYSDYCNFISLDYHNKKIETINEQIAGQKNLLKLSGEQKDLLIREVGLSKNQYFRVAQLTNREISRAEFERYEGNYLQAQRSLKSQENNFENIKLRIAELKSQILDLKLNCLERKKQLEINLSKAYEDVVSRISLWEQNYVLKSPIDGEVSFNKFNSENQNVEVGETVMTILPCGKDEIIGKLEMPIRGAGKVRRGQKVNIQLENYPYKEYGIVVGEIEDISEIPVDEKYMAEAVLVDGLRTSYGRELEFVQEMRGDAEIITEDISVFMRILSPLRAIFKKHLK